MSPSSMTGFADLTGMTQGLSWTWEARGVNGRGLDLRTRLPEGFEALDTAIREAFSKLVHRGSITVGLRVVHSAGDSVARINQAALEAAIRAAKAAGDRAISMGLDLTPLTTADLFAVRGVLETDPPPSLETAPVREAILADIPILASRFCAARAAEGEALARVISAQIDQIESLTRAARATAEARAARTGALLRTRLEAILGTKAPIDEGRLAQELALIAMKADVTEELDRIQAHADAARLLLVSSGPIGRKLDFLTQEFNREANTLCSKAGAADLTAIGLAIKAAIDQMREQVQNVE